MKVIPIGGQVVYVPLTGKAELHCLLQKKDDTNVTARTALCRPKHKSHCCQHIVQLGCVWRS